MKSYKIVASDLDGTLLNNQSQISRENLNAISELAKKGVYFGPSTGRTLCELPQELKNNPDIRFLIYSNGAVALDTHTGKSVMYCIPNSIGREILDVLNSYDTHLTFREDGQSYVDAAFQTQQHYDYYNVCNAHRVVVQSFSRHVDDFDTLSRQADNIEVFTSFFRNYDDKIACKKHFEKNSQLRVVEVSEYNLEIVNANAGKGNALYALADMLGVERSATISIGDSDNDSSIIKAAGLGLAVSNSYDALKEVADEIICSNEEHVIAYVLEHYFS